ncbi:hypothetical protein BSK59_13800 [Paenibacillus odorifer]|uniref:DHH family phosphoesterase n=1 Tax=Paenibacillus odorifer TaxID=189426 RepID=UPI00096F7F36|nr:DHH family phosphoesterase [Paenibacillus odorifer]OME55545.1 hypothetical protein BSK59_13800 [Paenibacillus odorifer]
MREWKQRIPKLSYSEFNSVTEKLAAINGIKDIDKFLNPSVRDTYDYRLLFNWETSVHLIVKYLESRKKIVIFLDADFDGVADGAVLYRHLSKYSDNIHIVHVQRSVGHGLRIATEIIPEDTDLLIIVDSSTNDVDACKMICEKDIPIIIIDHHDWEGVNNPFATIVNPKMPECKYPNKEASGTLVTWKICKAIDDHYGKNFAEDLKDLAGFSLLSDAMSVLEQENRYFIKYALENVTNTGIKVLIEELKIDLKRFDSTDFSFKVSPCITAITRFDKLEVALRLLLSDDKKECQQLSKELIGANEKRKIIQKNSVELVADQISPDDKCVVVVESSIGKGFNGVVAQQLTDVYGMPAIVMGISKDDENSYSGSFRTFADFDMRGFLKKIKSVNYSLGHAEAGGTGCQKEKLKSFKKNINIGIKDVIFDNSLIYELELSLEDINEDLILEVKDFYKISGKEFPVGNFLIKDVFSINKKQIGSSEDTLRTQLCSTSQTWFMDEEDYHELKPYLTGLKFRTDEEFIEEFPLHKTIDIVGTLNMNYWTVYRPRFNVQKTKQIFIEGYRLSQ